MSTWGWRVLCVFMAVSTLEIGVTAFHQQGSTAKQLMIGGRGERILSCEYFLKPAHYNSDKCARSTAAQSFGSFESRSLHFTPSGD